MIIMIYCEFWRTKYRASQAQCNKFLIGSIETDLIFWKHLAGIEFLHMINDFKTMHHEDECHVYLLYFALNKILVIGCEYPIIKYIQTHSLKLETFVMHNRCPHYWIIKIEILVIYLRRQTCKYENLNQPNNKIRRSRPYSKKFRYSFVEHFANRY